MPRFCGNCGKPLVEGAPFCGECGFDNSASLSASAGGPSWPPSKRQPEKKKKEGSPFRSPAPSVDPYAFDPNDPYGEALEQNLPSQNQPSLDFFDTSDLGGKKSAPAGFQDVPTVQLRRSRQVSPQRQPQPAPKPVQPQRQPQPAPKPVQPQRQPQPTPKPVQPTPSETAHRLLAFHPEAGQRDQDLTAINDWLEATPMRIKAVGINPDPSADANDARLKFSYQAVSQAPVRYVLGCFATDPYDLDGRTLEEQLDEFRQQFPDCKILWKKKTTLPGNDGDVELLFYLTSARK